MIILSTHDLDSTLQAAHQLMTSRAAQTVLHVKAMLSWTFLNPAALLDVAPWAEPCRDL